MDYHLKTNLPFVLKHWAQYDMQPHTVVKFDPTQDSDDAELEESGATAGEEAPLCQHPL